MMQKAITPYKSSWTHTIENKPLPSSLSWLTSSSSSSITTSPKPSSKRSNLVMENAVVVFARKGCCMGHVAQRLLVTHGVNPLVAEVDEQLQNKDEKLPIVFIGGKMFGGLENLMAAHINGDLVPMLRQAGALWL